MLRSEYHFLRENGADALGKMGTGAQPAIGELKKLLLGKYQTIGDAAAVALNQIQESN